MSDNQENIRSMGVLQLREVAARMGIKSPYRYKKRELLALIEGQMLIGQTGQAMPVQTPPPGFIQTPPPGFIQAQGVGFSSAQGVLPPEVAPAAPKRRGRRPNSARRAELAAGLEAAAGFSVPGAAVAAPPVAGVIPAGVVPPSPDADIILPPAPPKPRRGRPRKQVVDTADALEKLAQAVPEKLIDGEIVPHRAARAEVEGEPDARAVREPRARRTPRKRRSEEEIIDPTQLVPIAGILDVLDSCAFIRTSGYYPGTSDIYVSLSQVKKYNLRKGDAVTGEINGVKDVDSYKQKHFPLVQVSSVNGLTSEQAETRPIFEEGTSVPPTQRLRITPNTASVEQRLVDLVSPIAKGQRALICGPRHSGRTTLLHQISKGLREQNPELHLVTLLVGARPEEATEMTRTLKGEVVVSSLESTPEEQISVAELVLERAKRLAEQGHDVLLAVDSLTQLGRAYALTGAVSSRLVGSTAELAVLRPLNSFFLAARSIENSGSITIIGTVLSESVSGLDRLIEYDLLTSSGAQLVLDEAAVARREFPAINPVASSSRNEFQLLSVSEQNEVKRIRVRSEGR